MTITTIGLEDVRDNTKTRIVATHLHGAVGDDSTTPTIGDTTLGNETFRSAVDSTDDSVSNQVTLSLIIGSSENNGNDIKEHGWLDAAAGGNLAIRVTLTTITKTSDIQLFLDTTYTISVSES